MHSLLPFPLVFHGIQPPSDRIPDSEVLNNGMAILHLAFEYGNMWSTMNLYVAIDRMESIEAVSLSL